MSLLAAALWALSCVLDVCFVENGVYRKASDGPAIAGLFCLIPSLITVGAVELSSVEWTVICVGALSGVVFLAHVYLYFRALFTLNDAVNAEIFNTLGVLVVPLLAYLLLDERLAWLNYLAVGVAVVGILVLIGWRRARLSWAGVACLSGAVVSVSFLMVMQAWVLQFASYATAVWLFSTAAFLTALLIFAVPGARRRRIAGLCRRFGALFVVVQLLELGAVLGSQRATDLSPSVSLVALLECSLPIFVMIFSGLIAIGARLWGIAPARRLPAVLARQSTAAPSKIASMLLIIVAISLVEF